MKYRPSRDLPKFALEHKTTSPTKLAEIVLSERNTEIKPQAVTMWFSRHPQVLKELDAQIIASEIDQKVVDPTIFNNGTFEQLPTVKAWIQEMQDRRLVNISSKVATLKRVCIGYELPTDSWAMKHPDRLTLQDARDYIRKRREQGKNTHGYRIDVRDFLLSKGITSGKKISGAKESGKYSKLYLPPDIVREFLEGVRALNFEAYVVDLFEAKTGTRITAVLSALIENINKPEDYITVYDKGRRSKYPKGHPWDKHLDSELRQNLAQVIGERAEGKIFSIFDHEVRDINKAVLNDLIQKYHENKPLVRLLKLARNLPTHWLRHQFFQQCLHVTGWKYGVCAALGGSTVKSLEESYGQPPKAIVKKWGEEWLEKITI